MSKWTFWSSINEHFFPWQKQKGGSFPASSGWRFTAFIWVYFNHCMKESAHQSIRQTIDGLYSFRDVKYLQSKENTVRTPLQRKMTLNWRGSLVPVTNISALFAWVNTLNSAQKQVVGQFCLIPLMKHSTGCGAHSNELEASHCHTVQEHKRTGSGFNSPHRGCPHSFTHSPTVVNAHSSGFQTHFVWDTNRW